MTTNHQVAIATDRALTAIVKYGDAVYSNGLHAGVSEGSEDRQLRVETEYRNLVRLVSELSALAQASQGQPS